MNTRKNGQVENSGRSHAVVMGGSLAGLLAARVLSDHFENVTLIERAQGLPENFLLLGDAVCAFNPVYGQSMTTAALGAMALRECLREANGNLSQRFQKRLAKINAAPWLLATGEDYRYRETVGGSPTLMTRFMHRYMDHVVRLATHSVPVRKVLLQAFNMLAPPTALFQPRVLFRVLLNVVKNAFDFKRKTHENTNRNHGRNRQVGSSQTA